MHLKFLECLKYGFDNSKLMPICLMKNSLMNRSEKFNMILKLFLFYKNKQTTTTNHILESPKYIFEIIYILKV